MEYRSSNADGRYVHFGGAVVAGAEYGSGIELNPNSSGSAPNIKPCGDETNKGITLASKGTGTITIGSSGDQPLVITSTDTTFNGGAKIGSSGTKASEVRSFTVEFTAPLLSSGITEQAVESTYTAAGVSTGTVLMFTPTNPVNALYTWRARCSTVDELTLSWGHFGDSTIGSGESSNRGVLVQFRF